MSSNNSIKYESNFLIGSNKTGKLSPDEDGYYTLVVGALDVFNSTGAFYPLETGKKLFEESSSFMRRVKEGNCKGETGHPKRSPGQPQADYIQRVLSIEETNICCHFKSFRLEKGTVMDANGRPVVAIIAEVKPAGPNGPALKEALENKHENVCFSIRSLTRDVRSPTGIINKNLSTIVTFDWVTEPGISVAKKYHSPALESFGVETYSESDEEVEVTMTHIQAIQKRNLLLGASMEETDALLEDIKKDLECGEGCKLNPHPSFNW